MSILDDGKRAKILDLLNGDYRKLDVDELYSIIGDVISHQEIISLQQRLNTLIGLPIEILNIPREILKSFEPSQIGTIVGTLMDACIPQLDLIIPNSMLIDKIGLVKHEGILGEREGYPDYRTKDGYRLELKLLYVDPINVEMKRPPTDREASARLTQKVTYKNVDKNKDLLLVIAYQFRETIADQFSPTIIDVGIFPVINCIMQRDIRLSKSGGIWFGDFETPTILSRSGKKKLIMRHDLNKLTYGRKESEGMDFNEDTNFGKLARIPYKPLQDYLKKYNAK